MNKALIVVMLLFVCTVLTAPISAAFCQDNLSDHLSELLYNPATLLVFLIQLGLGFGLGYCSLKALKYLIAIVCILILGILLNIWQISGFREILEEGLRSVGIDPGNMSTIINLGSYIVALLGIFTILPIGLGFFVGAIFAVRQ